MKERLDMTAGVGMPFGIRETRGLACALLLLGLCVLAPAKAEQPDRAASPPYTPVFKAGLDAYRHNDPARAATLWQQAAEAGDPNAQINLGLLYETGTGLPRDDLRALHWYQRAADAGLAHAQRQLGRYYYDAFCARQDSQRSDAQQRGLAASWYQKAAAQGDDEARYRLGRMLLAGDCVRADEVAGEVLLTSAARNGHVASESLLGAQLLARGDSSVRLAEGVDWLTRAANHGDAKAARRLAQACRLRQHVSCEPGRALEWLARAAELGDESAQLTYAVSYKGDEPGRADAHQAETLLLRLEQSGTSQWAAAARIELARLWESQRLGKIDRQKAAHWRELAGEEGRRYEAQQPTVLAWPALPGDGPGVLRVAEPVPAAASATSATPFLVEVGRPQPLRPGPAPASSSPPPARPW